MGAGSMRRLPSGAKTRQSADIDDIYQRCLAGQGGTRTTATEVYTWARSPFAVWSRLFAPREEQDPPSQFINLLFQTGREHEERVVQTWYPGAEPVAFESDEQGFRMVLEAMASGASAIQGGPVFWLSDGLQGRVDVLERKDTHPSVFGPYHYVVKEIKVAKNLGDPHYLQGAFYNRLIGRIQQYTPEAFSLINRDGVEFTCAYEQERLNVVLGEIRRIHGGLQPPPVYGGGVWPWQSYTDKCAIERGDVSLVAGVGGATRTWLVRSGFYRVEDLARASPEALVEIRGIGEAKAARLIANAQALTAKRHIQLGEVNLPRARTEIFLDLEGSGEQPTEDGLIAMDYLIGVLVRRDDKEAYHPFVAQSLEGEQAMFDDFLAWLRPQERYRIYHWHHYEATHLRQLAERYGREGEAQRTLFPHLHDLF